MRSAWVRVPSRDRASGEVDRAAHRYGCRVRPETVAEYGSWRIVVPASRVVEPHLALVRGVGRIDALDQREAAGLIEAYRAATSALHHTFGVSGFVINFAVNWHPSQDGVGEPDPIEGAACAVHVFGRKPGEPISPIRALTLPRSARRSLPPTPDLLGQLRQQLSGDPEPLIIEPPQSIRCEGCTGAVLTEQERWRSRDVRVIRPKRVLIDPHVIVLPIRHVVSLRDLEPDEASSMSARMFEALVQFRLASGSTGLSCFANDGLFARQETPHVQLHVYGRSPVERTNPVRLLASWLPSGQPTA